MSIDPVPGNLQSVSWTLFFLYWGISGLRLKKTREQAPDYSQHLLLTVLAFLLVFPTFWLGPLNRLIWPNRITPWLGLALTLASQAFAVWGRLHLGKYWSAQITLKEGHKVIKSGPYALVRHPIYTGLVLSMLGTAVGIGEWPSLLAFVLMSLTYAKSRPIGESHTPSSRPTRIWLFVYGTGLHPLDPCLMLW
jgi:protein-S-isoprenylcysteine O-methyltransferase Ste14